MNNDCVYFENEYGRIGLSNTENSEMLVKYFDPTCRRCVYGRSGCVTQRAGYADRLMRSLMENVYYLLLHADDEKINVLNEEGRKASVQRRVACLHVARAGAAVGIQSVGPHAACPNDIRFSTPTLGSCLLLSYICIHTCTTLSLLFHSNRISVVT